MVAADAAYQKSLSIVADEASQEAAREADRERRRLHVAKLRREHERQVESLHRHTAYEVQDRHDRQAIEAEVAEKFSRATLGPTILDQVNRILLHLAEISEGEIPGEESTYLVQHGVRLAEVQADGRAWQVIRTTAELRALIVRANGPADAFRSPWIEFVEDKDGHPHTRDAEPCEAAWRAALASGTWPGVRTLAEFLSDFEDQNEELETIEQRAARLLREAMAARQQWTATIEELAELTQWPGGPASLGREIERVALLAGYLTRRPVTASGRPRLHPRTRRALVQIVAPVTAGSPAAGSRLLALNPSHPPESRPDLRR